MVMIVTNELRLGMRLKHGKYGIGERRIVASGRWPIGPQAADDRTSRNAEGWCPSDLVLSLVSETVTSRSRALN